LRPCGRHFRRVVPLRTFPYRISCHSSIVKVQRTQGRAPQARTSMMNLRGPSVNDINPLRRPHWPADGTPDHGARGGMVRCREAGVKRVRRER